MKQQDRKALVNKMVEIFGDRIAILPTDMQHILIEDLITAFENRLDVLNQAQPTLRCITEIAVKA